jgi:hypothetical protein
LNLAVLECLLDREALALAGQAALDSRRTGIPPCHIMQAMRNWTLAQFLNVSIRRKRISSIAISI